MSGVIRNMPQNEMYDYEFIVVTPREDGDYDFHSQWATTEAYDVAKKIGGQICHNVRISGKEIKPKAKKFMETKSKELMTTINPDKIIEWLYNNTTLEDRKMWGTAISNAFTKELNWTINFLDKWEKLQISLDKK